MQKIILYLTNHLIQDNIIEEEERELYRYGFTVAFLFLVNVLTATILSITFGNIGVLSFFLFCMIPFRKLIGGFHIQLLWNVSFQTRFLCYLFKNSILPLHIIPNGCYWLPRFFLLYFFLFFRFGGLYYHWNIVMITDSSIYIMSFFILDWFFWFYYFLLSFQSLV